MVKQVVLSANALYLVRDYTCLPLEKNMTVLGNCLRFDRSYHSNCHRYKSMDRELTAQLVFNEFESISKIAICLAPRQWSMMKEFGCELVVHIFRISMKMCNFS